MGKRIIHHLNGDIYNFSNIINGDLVMGNIMGGVHINGNSIRQNCIKCSNNMITKEINVKGNYQSLINESIVDIDYYEDNEESIQLTAPDNIIDYIHVEEDTSILYVKMDNVSISTSYTNRPKIVIKHHGLKSISNGGCSDIKGDCYPGKRRGKPPRRFHPGKKHIMPFSWKRRYRPERDLS